MATRQPRNRYLVCIFMLYFSRWAKGKLLEWTKPNKMRAALNRLYAKESLWCSASPKNVRVLSALQYSIPKGGPYQGCVMGRKGRDVLPKKWAMIEYKLIVCTRGLAVCVCVCLAKWAPPRSRAKRGWGADSMHNWLVMLRLNGGFGAICNHVRWAMKWPAFRCGCLGI